MLRQHAFNPGFDAETVALSLAAARGRARALRRRLRAPSVDEEDFRQTILLDLVTRADRFNAARGSWPAFVCVVTRHAAAEIARSHSCAAALVSLLPHDLVDDRHRVSAADLAIDLKRAIEHLPRHLQNLVALIAETGSLTRAQRASAISPATFYRALRDLRLRFIAAGLATAARAPTFTTACGRCRSRSSPRGLRRRETVWRSGE
jgi:DNA-directed RNA polymerase specialized sigma24 family protein